MPRIAQRFLVVLFALLQCMAPLLHAHASAADHGGLHLPDLPARSAGQDGQACQAAPLAVLQAAIGPQGALEARQDGLPPDPAAPAACPLRLTPMPAGTWRPGPYCSGTPRLSRHLLPLPCAPPGA